MHKIFKTLTKYHQSHKLERGHLRKIRNSAGTGLRGVWFRHRASSNESMSTTYGPVPGSVQYRCIFNVVSICSRYDYTNDTKWAQCVVMTGKSTLVWGLEASWMCPQTWQHTPCFFLSPSVSQFISWGDLLYGRGGRGGGGQQQQWIEACCSESQAYALISVCFSHFRIELVAAVCQDKDFVCVCVCVCMKGVFKAVCTYVVPVSVSLSCMFGCTSCNSPTVINHFPAHLAKAATAAVVHQTELSHSTKC